MNNNIMSLLPLIMGMNGGVNADVLSAFLNKENSFDISKNIGGINPLLLIMMTKLFNNKPQKQDSDDNSDIGESIKNVDNLSKLSMGKLLLVIFVFKNNAFFIFVYYLCKRV